MSEIQWYIQVGAGKKAGPVSFERLQQIAQQGKIFPTTKVRSNDEEATWIPAQDVPGLFEKEAIVDESVENADATTPEIVAEDLGEGDSVTEEPTNFGIAPDETTASLADKPVDANEEPDSNASSFAIDPGKKQSKTASSGKFSFTIDTGKSSSKKETPSKSDEKAKSPDTAPAVKIDLAGGAKEKKSDKSSAAVRIDLAGGAKEKKSDKSSAAAKIDLAGGAKEKKSDKSSAAVRINLTGGAKEKKSDDSSVEDAETKTVETKTERKEKTKSRDARKVARKTAKPGSSTALFLRISSILSFGIGVVGAAGLFWLCFQQKEIALGAVSGAVVLCFGVILGFVSWILASLSDRTAAPKEDDDQMIRSE